MNVRINESFLFDGFPKSADNSIVDGLKHVRTQDSKKNTAKREREFSLSRSERNEKYIHAQEIASRLGDVRDATREERKNGSYVSNEAHINKEYNKRVVRNVNTPKPTYAKKSVSCVCSIL